MSITEIIMKMPCWYFLIMILFSLFYAIRGLMSEMKKYAEDESLSRAFKVIYAYIQEILFKIIFTASGFIALLIVNYIFSSVKSINEIGVGTAIILIFLIIWGISGISGYLTYLIVSGKFPIIPK
jgi:stalled ribosome rescue protein Dom34